MNPVVNSMQKRISQPTDNPRQTALSQVMNFVTSIPKNNYNSMVQMGRVGQDLYGKNADPSKRDQILNNATHNAMPLVGGFASPILGNEEAQVIPKLAQKFDSQGNISMDEIGTVMDMAKRYLKVPKDQISKMGVGQILAELGGLLNDNQHFAFRELPGLK